MARLDMRRNWGGFGGVRPVCRRGPGGGVWHERVGSGRRKKGRTGKRMRRRKLLLDLHPGGREGGGI